jgi:hypothetical protein
VSRSWRTVDVVHGQGHVAPDGDGRTAAFPGVGLDEQNVFVMVLARSAS